MSSKVLIAVVGPTAIGKTKLAIEIAQHFGTEIISADSRQFFKEMRIGTAVPSEKELNTAKHHFIQHLSVEDSYSVGDFERDALNKLEELFALNDVVVMVGGSGLYVDAVTKGLDEFPEVDPSIRTSLNERLQSAGLEALQKELKTRDPIYYEQVDLENPHRLIRALEVCIASGKPYSSFLNQNRNPRPFQSVYVGIEADREIIYERINQRVDIMVKDGLLEEAKSLHSHKHLNALQTVGYRELFEYFEGNCELEFSIAEIKKNSRRFAKRQLTWLRKNEQILWVDFEAKPAAILSIIENKIQATNGN
ncbi:tRNA (adenosine(37)-N6)-dimethylallyltransferase MiaA [Flagellimonas myxillae]|uniref:tRNA (adenosine(37)-N6)-dimethylallyltransferase MiaA n=1 Tax=Flagellimonas myxillae TaxID=2942214 RepID=UPI00201F8EC8|nr:tRNA (adenosine(37)-N6)-dimethylallyltransferase MiaA [Muricauda myxillae]MCL6265678.1 tRNA (adenosine(37)-N6)-dimethylallyltransferase MiaA [Muricauda myxillae]